MYSKDKDGKKVLHPIDFGGSCLDMGKFLMSVHGKKYDRTTKALHRHKDTNPEAFKEAIYEVSKVWFKKEKEIKEHLKKSCQALGVPGNEYNALTTVIDNNKQFMMQGIKITINYSTLELKPFIMGKNQITEYEKQNNIGNEAAQCMQI